MAYRVVERAMISGIDRVVCIRAAYDRVNDRRRLGNVITRLLRNRIALLLARITIRHLYVVAVLGRLVYGVLDLRLNTTRSGYGST